MADTARMDRIGACASAICAVHCVLTGAAFGLLSVAGLAFLREPWVEAIFFVSTVLIGGWALRHGLRRHGSWLPSAFFIAGLGLIVAKHLLLGEAETGFWAVVFAVASSLCLIAFFLTNARLPHKSCGCFQGVPCAHPPPAEAPDAPLAGAAR